MPTKNYLCASINNGATHYATVFDPASQVLMLKAQWNPALMDATIATMESELQAIYSGTATIGYNYQQFIGVSAAGEAVWTIALDAYNNASADFRNYMKLMAYSNTTSRTLASLNQSVTKKAGENWAQPVAFLGFEHEKAYFAGYYTGAAPNVRVYELSASGVTPVTSAASTPLGSLVPALVNSAGETYLAFAALSGGNLTGYMLRKTSGVWGQVATAAGASPTLYPLSEMEALAAAAGVTPSYIVGFGSVIEAVRLPQGQDTMGSFQINGATLTNLVTSGTVNMQSAFNAAVGGTATVDNWRQVFTYAEFPTPAFWQSLVSADEII